jgi:hypothetical protein
MGGYDVAQICLNGHVVNDSVQRSPVHSTARCSRCGAETISACPSCKKSIRGEYQVDGVFAPCYDEAPAFCHECGKPYPWTESRLEAAHELVQEMGLDIPEKTLLTESIHDLIRDTPKAQAAAVRFQRLTEKAKPVVKEGMKTLLAEVISQSAKKILGW